MQESFLHFLSKENCIISVNGENIGVIDNKNVFELDIITKCESVFINYSPISDKQNFIPYSFQLDTKNKPTTNNEYIKVVPYPNNHYDIIMKPFYYYQIEESKVLLNQKLDNFYISVVSSSKTMITIYSGTSIVFTLDIPRLIDAKASINKDSIVITGIIDENTYYLLIIDCNDFHIIHNDISHSIEESIDSIQSLKKLFDLSRHAKVCKFDFTDKKSQLFHVYEEDNYQGVHSSLLLPKNFLQCIQTNDEKLLNSMLDYSLQNTPITQFKSFFGDIKEIHLNRHAIYQDKINYTIKSKTYKNYNFIFENNLIKEIQEIF